MAFLDSLIGTPSQSSTSTVTNTPVTNNAYVIGGILLGLGALALAIWAFGGFKKKGS